MSSLTAIVQLLLVLGLMVLVHEFGHFAVAKLCGIRVEVFSIGFGKRLFGYQRGDTDYRLSILPLGGYVKMAGDIPGEVPSGDPGEFNSHPRWQRILVALAGPIANFILALGLMTGGYMLHNEVNEYISGPATTDYISPSSPIAKTGIQSGDTIVRYNNTENPNWEDVFQQSALNLNQTIPFAFLHNGQRTDTSFFIASKDTPETFTVDTLGLVPKMQPNPVEVLKTLPNTPAAKAGLQPKDQLAAIDGIPLHSVPALLTYLQDRKGAPSVITLIRNGQTIPTPIVPELAENGGGAKSYRLGFEFVQPPIKVEQLPLGQSLKASWKFNRKNAFLIRDVLHGMFTRHISVKSLSGPIGIGQQVHQAASMQGWMPLIGIMAYISLNLGIFNLLPVPILDGGMIVFLLIESLLRRDLNQQIKERVYQVAFVCIVAFAAFVIFNDITKLGLFTKLKP